MSLPEWNGPLSLIFTTTDKPVDGLLTRSLVPKGSVLWAAVSP